MRMGVGLLCSRWEALAWKLCVYMRKRGGELSCSANETPAVCQEWISTTFHFKT